MRSIVSHLLLLLAATGVAVAPVRAQISGKAPLAPAVSRAIDPVLKQAQRDGLPTSALRSKAEFGQFRGFSTSRIVSAVTVHADRMRAAKAALAPIYEDGEIEAGAVALGEGISAQTLRKIREKRPKSSVADPVSVLTDWVVRKVPAHDAANYLLQLLDRSISDQQLAMLGVAIGADVADGKSAARSLSTRATSIIAALGPHSVLGGTSGDPVPTATGMTSGHEGRAGGKK